ncbi:MAG TPA: hypothetical protein VK828_09550 [Terriglobales bacterium]|nr:hypothetical protein [Terriglobales bacterium]
MKILLVHPEDSVDAEPWAATHWDFAVDLGWSGRAAYARQSEQLGFRIVSMSDLLDHEQHRCRIRDLLAVGLDQLIDSESLDSESIDWWDVYSVHPYAQIEQLLRVSLLAEQIPAYAEIFATHPHVTVSALEILLRETNVAATNAPKIKIFQPGPNTADREAGLRTLFRRYRKAASALRPSQLAEIAFDKWDAGYQLRRHFARSPKIASTPVILLPSSYGNVTRAQVAYARMLPHRRFLLVVTRPSGRLPLLPDNVEIRSLASYAPPPLPATDAELTRVLARWQKVQRDVFEQNTVLRLANRLHVFDGFAGFLKNTLRVRDAWREVFAREPITAVLSADEYNPHTRLPTLLAKSRKLRTIFCEHGALTMSFGIRRGVSDNYLVRGEMARDYYLNRGLPAEKIVVGSPAHVVSPLPSPNSIERDWIVFYSEPFELSRSRTTNLYQELLCELCSLADGANRKVIVKLHPFESLKTRQALIDRVLSPDQRRLVEVREGPMTPDLFSRAWCCLTVESSVAVESTINGIPCFLCSWFDGSWYDYGKQFAKFSAGYPLDSPQRIREIPQLIEQIQITESIRQSLQTTISPEHLESVLSGS